MQYIVQGKGLLDPVELQQKLDELTGFIPVLKLKLEGNRWTFNGKVPQLTVHNAAMPADWNDTFFTAPLDSRIGSCFAFHLFQTDYSTLVIRVLHSAMDGVGALKLIEYFFQLLNCQAVPSITDHPKDHDVRRVIGRIPSTIRGGYTSKWKGLAQDIIQTGSVKYKTEVLNFSERIEEITGSVARWYMDQTHESARFMIPVNIRRHGIHTEALSNLCLPIYLRTTVDQGKEDIQSQLLKELAECNELAYEPTETLGSLIPGAILGNLFGRMIHKAQRTNRYPMSGFISDLGKVDLSNFSTRSFEATNFLSLPVYVPLAPLCLISCYHQNGTRVAFSVPDFYDIGAIKRSLQQAMKPVRPAVERITTFEPAEGELVNDMRISWSEVLKIPVEEIGLNDRFSDLGGESISLIFLIHVVGSKFVPDKKGLFMNDVLKLAGSVTVLSMLKIISTHRQ